MTVKVIYLNGVFEYFRGIKSITQSSSQNWNFILKRKSLKLFFFCFESLKNKYHLPLEGETMITSEQILEILIKYDPNPFMVQDTLELNDRQYFCNNLETLFENVQEKQGTLSAIQAFDDGFCCINDSII